MTTQGLTDAAGNFGSPLQLLIILAVVLLLFGGKRLRNLGGDLGSAIKGFKNAVAPSESEKPKDEHQAPYQLGNEQAELIRSVSSEKPPVNRAG
ncbi:MAG: twin-arginine translocase TatA/TatE family subunit [Gammaproteobacteria bacterium]|nr:MAG: twin-arginine translocase TatA/TatE family subunit [Gammaproteobacteria bacterium]